MPRQISLTSGFVELTDGKTKRLVKFEGALVIGNTVSEVRREFKWSKTFLGAKFAKERKRAEELEAAGKVVLREIRIDKQLGPTFVDSN
jgi:hypothetical protein